MYCPKELEPAFIEVLIPNKKIYLIGVVYKQRSNEHYKFNNDFMTTLIEKLTLENKPSINPGNFNLNLIKYMQNTGGNQFLERILSNNFIPQINLPTKITEKTAILIDNILTNIILTVIVYQVISLLTFLTTCLSF